MYSLVKVLVTIGSSASIGFGVWHFLYPQHGNGIRILTAAPQSY